MVEAIGDCYYFWIRSFGRVWVSSGGGWWWQIWVAELLGCVIRFRVVLNVFQVLRDVVIQARLPMWLVMLRSFSRSVTYDRFTTVFGCFTAVATAMESGFHMFALGLECDLGLNVRFIPCTWAFWPF